MSRALGDIQLEPPVLAAPMAGGPSTPEFVVAAGRAGALGFLAAGYLSPEALAEQISAVRTSALPFGVNVFAPNPLPVDPAEFQRYSAELQIEADVYGLDLSQAQPREDDDHWAAKIELLVSDPVPIVSFTFAVPDQQVIRRLQKAGTLIVQTITSPGEAELAAAAGVDALAVQASVAGGHSGTLTPLQPAAAVPLLELLAQVRAVTNLPMLAAGGLTNGDDVANVISAGATAAVVGTVLLRADESGASTAFKDALVDPARTETVMTRAFTGRPARALRNGFVDRHASAPSGYPALHHLTRPLRRAAAEAGDAERINLWAGTGFRSAAAEPVETILTRLGSAL